MKKTIYILSLAVICLSCQKQIGKAGARMGFDVKEVDTKSVITTDNIAQKYGQFYCDVWIAPDDLDAALGREQDFVVTEHYVDHGLVVYSESATPYKWNFTSDNYWLIGINKCFWSWAPTEIPPSRLSVGTPTNGENGTLPFAYSLPAANLTTDAVNQQDLLFAYNYLKLEDTSPEGTVNIHFYHALSWIRFMVVKSADSFDPELEIENITLDNIYSSGDCVFTPKAYYVGGKFVWSNNNINKSSFGQNMTVADDFVANNTLGRLAVPKAPEQTYVSSTEKAFMIIPQKVNANATVSIRFRRSDGSTIVRSAPFPTGDEWEAGYFYTYNIKATSLDDQISISISYKDWIDGGTGQI